MSVATLVGFLAIVISLYILWRIKQVLLLAFAAVVFATVINQLVKLIQQKCKLSRNFAIAISVSSVLIFIAGFIALIIPPFIEQFQELIDLVPMGLERLSSWNEWLVNWMPQNFIKIESLTQNIQSWTNGLIGNFVDLFSSTLVVVVNTLLVIAVTIMLLINPAPYRQIFVLLFPAFYRHRIKSILKQCEQNLGGWAIGILFNMAVIAILSGLGLWILGIRLPLANSLLAGILTFIPNIGPALSVIPPTAMALLDAPWKAIAVVILYIVIQQVESNILTPLVMERQVSLLPAITLLSQVAFAVFFGVFGLFLALPITVIAQVWLKEILIKDILDPWQSERHKPKNKPRKLKVTNNVVNH